MTIAKTAFSELTSIGMVLRSGIKLPTAAVASDTVALEVCKVREQPSQSSNPHHRHADMRTAGPDGGVTAAQSKHSCCHGASSETAPGKSPPTLFWHFRTSCDAQYRIEICRFATRVAEP
jgi:hypothetical protein